MRAIVLESYGETDVLQIAEIADPVPGPEEVLVDVVATALNRADLLQRRGFYPSPPLAGSPRPPEIPGMEFSGRVAARGRAGRAPWSVGDEVMGIVGGGAYAERIVVHERQLLSVPGGGRHWPTPPPSPRSGSPPSTPSSPRAGSPRAAPPWSTPAVRASAPPPIQIGRGDRRPDRRHRLGRARSRRCRALGADLAVDYARRGLRGRGAGCSPADAGVDVVLDVIGGDYIDRNIDALRGRRPHRAGRGDGRRPHRRSTSASSCPKRATLVGTVLRARPLEEKIAITRRFAAEILPLFESGAVRPVIDSRYPLDQIADGPGPHGVQRQRRQDRHRRPP